jgi:hypothetical protein
MAKVFDLNNDIEVIDEIKVSYNTGCALIDIPTGKFELGFDDHMVLNGGVGLLGGVIGIGNNFKSTFEHWLTLSAFSNFQQGNVTTYDTEINIQASRLESLANQHSGWGEAVYLIKNGRWKITDKTIYSGNEFFEKYKEYAKAKVKAGEKFTFTTPFLDSNAKPIRLLYPTFNQIDSFTEFETDDVSSMRDGNELGDSGANTIHMRQGLAKTRFFSELMKPLHTSNSPMIITAHVGKAIPMDAKAPPVKKLQYLKNGDVIKGVTDKFYFMSSYIWHCYNAAPFLNDATKSSEYPLSDDPNIKGETDLMMLSATLIRNKNGPSGQTIQMLVSQREGILPSLSEFHYLKSNDRFGIVGNSPTAHTYAMALLPDVKIGRTIVRGKIDSDHRLRRAINISCDIKMMINHWPEKYPDLYCTPDILFDDIKKLGYSWDEILDTTNKWSFLDDEDKKQNYLSTLDLLRMRKELYKPTFLTKNEQSK